MTISVVVPVYNGETTIYQLFNKVRKELEGSFSYKIILVCDPGTDNTMTVTESIATAFPENSIVLYNEKRLGQHGSILSGIEASSGDIVVTMDDDLQHDPVYIPALIEKQAEGDYDVVYAVFGKQAHGRLRNFASFLFRKLLIVGVPGICPWYSPFRLIKGNVARKLAGVARPYVFIDGMLGRLTGSFGAIDAEHMKRGGGRSAYGLFRLIKHAAMILWYYY